MVLVQTWPFLNVFFLGIIGQEYLFYDILERKNAFLGYKNKKFKKSKNCDFSKGVNLWFWSKNGHFFFSFFKHCRPGKCFLRYFRTKKMPFKAIKTRSSKSVKIEVFPKGLTYGFGPKLPKFQFSFLCNIGQENVFYDILERINAFLGYKDKNLKNSKNWDFSKGVNQWFWSKNANFSMCFLSNIGQENGFYDILERKNVFLGYKDKKYKMSKNWIFPKGLTYSFGLKMAIFECFFF